MRWATNRGGVPTWDPASVFAVNPLSAQKYALNGVPYSQIPHDRVLAQIVVRRWAGRLGLFFEASKGDSSSYICIETMRLVPPGVRWELKVQDGPAL